MATACHRFTWTEKLLGFAIVTIFITVSYPIYARHLVSAKRHRAEIALEHLASRMGEFYSLQGTYKHVTPKVLSMEEINKNPGYRLKIIRNIHDHFTVSAIPVGEQKIKDTKCATLSLTDSGKRYINGTGTVSECWFL